MHGLLHDIGIAIIAATIFGILAFKLRQPIILGYLVAGALIGPQFQLKLVTDTQNIEIISEIGLLLLLFIIGMEMNVQTLRTSGRQLLVAGFGQFAACVLLGLGFFGLLGLQLFAEPGVVLYVSIACALSSTAIVVKLLYDKVEFDTIPGRITIGILVIQDIYAIIILAFQPNFSDPDMRSIASALGGTVALLCGGFLLSKYVLQRVFVWVAKTPEMVVAISIGWCALIAGAAGLLGVSKEMGALIAGLSISAFPYSIHVSAKTLPLRDFFLTLFFISLGMKITAPTTLTLTVVPILILFVIVSRMLTVYPLLHFAGAGRRTSFIASINLMQISEFSLVIAALGYQPLQHFKKPEIFDALVYTMAVMAVMSSYVITNSGAIYRCFERCLALAGLRTVAIRATDVPAGQSPDIVVLGCHRVARAIIDKLDAEYPKLLARVTVMDFNLEVLSDLSKRGVRTVFGDISSMDSLRHAHLEQAKLILSTIPDMLLRGTTNLELVKACRALSANAAIVATADSAAHVERLKIAGATDVLLPYEMLSERIVEQLALSKDS
jgi:Kef-type K+ transport system membrane component KefB